MIKKRGMQKGFKHSEETKKKMSETAKKRVGPNTGKKFSIETRKKMSKAQKGRKITQETRKKISEAQKGKPGHTLGKHWKLSEKTKQKMRGRVPWNKGKSGYTTSRKGKKYPHLQGENSANWKKNKKTTLNNSIRRLAQYKQWRSDIFERDNWTCQTCMKRGCELNAHHIKELHTILKEYNIKKVEQAFDCLELWDIKNGVTLCKECHELTKHGNPNLYNK